jgi:CHAT domain-containing protein/Tfp pilus assembly protein PilF
MKSATAVLVAGLLGGCARDPPRPARASNLDSLVVLGEQIYRREEYDSVRVFLGPIAQQARATADSVAEARARTWLGLASWRLSDYPRARFELERSVALKRVLGLERELWRSYNGLGLVAWNEGRLADALARFESATAAAERAGDSVGIGSTAGNIGLVHTELGDFVAARAGFERMRRVGVAQGNWRAEGNALNNLGMLDIRVGDAERAIQSLTQALQIYRSNEYATGEQNALGQMGTAYAALGEPQHAFAALDSALQRARGLGLRQEEASDLEALAELHRIAGDYPRALELYAEAKGLNRELGQPLELGTDLRNEAEIHAQLDDLDVAIRSVEAALVAHREAGARLEELSDLVLLAELSDRTGQRAEAGEHLLAARELATNLDVRIARLAVALGDARIADRRGDATRVLAILDGARADLRAGGYDTEWEAELFRARAEARLGRWDRAAAAGHRAVAAVERVRARYGSGMLRTTYGADRGSVYAELVVTLRRLGQVEDALVVSDAARGRALLEARVAAGPGAGGDSALAQLGEIDGLLASISEAEREAINPATTARRTSLPGLYRRLDGARRRYEAALARRRDGGAGALAAGTAAGEIQSVLRHDEVLIEYLVTRDRLVAFVVTCGRVTTFERPISERNLVGRVRLARSVLARAGPPRASDAPVLDALHDLLITPAALAPEVRRLVVVPHGVLSYLPFAALRNPATGRYLVESMSVLFVPSAAGLVDLRRRAGPSTRSFQATVFAPFPDRLPATALEAQALRSSVRAEVRLGPRATEAGFRDAVAAGGVLHVATHGVLDARAPLFSRIEFSRGGSDPSDDGRLEVHELLDLPVVSPLVFLSGCETGLGVVGSTGFARGEDFATLAQAFLQAGADNVIATLWRVEDAGAAAFAERFYRHGLDDGPAEALAQAQRDLLKGRHRAPFYWAGYVVNGRGAGRTQETAGVSVRQ